MADDCGDFDIARVAGLARLALTPDQQALYQMQLAGILAYAAQISAVSTDGVPQVTQTDASPGTPREDAIAPSLSAGDALRNAPDADAAAALFHVPRVLG